MTKYCGMEIGKDITCKQVERLFNFLHANYSKQDFIAFSQEQLNQIAQDNRAEWE